MIKAILFDTDGTTIRRGYFSDRLAADSNVSLDTILPFFQKEFQLCKIGRADLKAEMEKYLPKLNWHGSVESLLQYWFDSENHPNTELLDYVKELRSQGIICGFASDSESYRAEYIKKQMGFTEIFDKLFFSCDIGHLKSSQEFWQYVADHLPGLAKDEVLVWDNKQENADAASKFGFNAKVYKDVSSYRGGINEFI